MHDLPRSKPCVSRRSLPGASQLHSSLYVEDISPYVAVKVAPLVHSDGISFVWVAVSVTVCSSVWVAVEVVPIVVDFLIVLTDVVLVVAVTVVVARVTDKQEHADEI
jgi:hypothetical protein